MAPSRFKPTVLVAPLDWGLGHATRVIPLVRALEKYCRVLLAGDGAIQHLLQEEFPHLPFLHLPGYDVSYARSKSLLPLAMAVQVPRILRAIRREKAWLQKAVAQHNITAVVSDNRYGLHHPSIPTVFVTHQLQIQSGLGKAADALLRKWNYRFINRFTECWIPDNSGEQNLGGDLSHPVEMPAIQCHYIGAQSRLSPGEPKPSKHLLVLLSGPEPQRGLLEEKMIEALKGYDRNAILLRGLPGAGETPFISSNVQVFNHLPAAELQELVEQASLVISRSGYSTVMDLAALQARAILVPTPGQTEQEYLVTHLEQIGFAPSARQESFNLHKALERAASFEYTFPTITPFDLDGFIRSFIQRIEATPQQKIKEPIAP